MRSHLEELAQAIHDAEHAVVLTGAGISTESGIPDFRSRDGLWRQVDPMRVATLTALRQRPVEFFQFYTQRLSKLTEAKPNAGHRALARLEQAGLVKAIVTQNVDGLHQAAGSRQVVEVHGSLRLAHCITCGREYPISVLPEHVETEADLPRCEACLNLVKPAVVLFEEMLPAVAVDRAFDEARRADLFLVVGSSLEVGPVNTLPVVAVKNRARLAIINLEETHLDSLASWVIHEKAGAALSSLSSSLGCAEH